MGFYVLEGLYITPETIVSAIVPNRFITSIRSYPVVLQRWIRADCSVHSVRAMDTVSDNWMVGVPQDSDQRTVVARRAGRLS